MHRAKVVVFHATYIKSEVFDLKILFKTKFVICK